MSIEDTEGVERVEVRVEHPTPLAILDYEGGRWQPWKTHAGSNVHAVLFADGSVFDVVNGWRSRKIPVCPNCGELLYKYPKE